VIAALGAVGVETTSLVAIFASAGLAVGLALQGSLGNFASGVLLLIFRPFNIDDVVTVGGNTGKVSEIGLFATTLVTVNNEKVVVPNSGVTGNAIINLTAFDVRRGVISVGVAYGSDVAAVSGILLEAARKADLVLSDPEPAVAFVGLGASSIDFDVRVWAKTPDWAAMVGNVRTTVYDELNAAGIDIPFNQIVVHQAA
jgi:small conductance mechanosensitive channel